MFPKLCIRVLISIFSHKSLHRRSGCRHWEIRIFEQRRWSEDSLQKDFLKCLLKTCLFRKKWLALFSDNHPSHRSYVIAIDESACLGRKQLAINVRGVTQSVSSSWHCLPFEPCGTFTLMPSEIRGRDKQVRRSKQHLENILNERMI